MNYLRGWVRAAVKRLRCKNAEMWKQEAFLLILAVISSQCKQRLHWNGMSELSVASRRQRGCWDHSVLPGATAPPAEATRSCSRARGRFHRGGSDVSSIEQLIFCTWHEFNCSLILKSTNISIYNWTGLKLPKSKRNKEMIQ